MKKFSQYLLGNHFTLTTGNKAIKKIFDSKTEISPIAARHIVRCTLIPAQYDYELKFRSTKQHCNADTLSRLPTSVKSELPVDNMIYCLQIDTLPVTSTEIWTEKLKVKTLVDVLSHLQNGKWPDKISDKIKTYYNKWEELIIEDGLYYGDSELLHQNNWEIRC